MNEEIKNLKEQVSNQANDLVELNTLQKNLEKIKVEKEELLKTNKELKNNIENLEKEKQKLTKANKEDNLGLKKVSAFRRVQTLAKKGPVKGANIEKDKILLQNQINMLKKMKDEEKKDYEEKIEKIKIEMATLKVKYLNKQYEEDVLLLKYKNTIKAIANQCKLKGIKLSLNLVKV